MVKLKDFSVSNSKYCYLLMREYFLVNWWIYCIPLIACILAGLFDFRFILVALMIMFILIPMALYFVYVTYGLLPENRYSIMKKNAIVNEKGIELHLSEEYVKNTNKHIFISWTTIEKIKITNHFMLIFFKTGKFRFLVVPTESFYKIDDFKVFVDLAVSQLKN